MIKTKLNLPFRHPISSKITKVYFLNKCFEQIHCSVTKTPLPAKRKNAFCKKRRKKRYNSADWICYSKVLCFKW